MASRTSSDVLSAKRDRPIKPQKILPAKAHNPVLQHNRSDSRPTAALQSNDEMGHERPRATAAKSPYSMTSSASAAGR
jgi:hypothetical protein